MEISSEHQSTATRGLRSGTVCVRTVTDVEQTFGRNAKVLEDPEERHRAGFDKPKAFAHVNRFEIILKAQTLQFVPGLVVGEDDLGSDTTSKIAKQIGQTGSGARARDRRGQPSLFDLKPTCRVRILGHRTPRRESDGLHSSSKILQFL